MVTKQTFRAPEGAHQDMMAVALVVERAEFRFAQALGQLVRRGETSRRRVRKGC